MHALHASTGVDGTHMRLLVRVFKRPLGGDNSEGKRDYREWVGDYELGLAGD